MKKLSLAVLSLGLGLCVAATAAPKTQPAPSAAAPFGVTIGKTTCEEVGRLFDAKGSQTSGGLLSLSHPKPGSVYPGATSLQVLCDDIASPAMFVTLVASKGGIGSDSARQAYASLSKYKLLKGGPVPSVGNGYAMFQDGAGNIVELNSPHMSFEFEVNYMTSAVHERLKAQHKAKNDTKAKQQGNL